MRRSGSTSTLLKRLTVMVHRGDGSGLKRSKAVSRIWMFGTVFCSGARHQPAAWDQKKKQAAYAPELSERLTRELSWRATDDVDRPWSTKVGRRRNMVRPPQRLS